MTLITQAKTFFLVLGDLAALYIGLFLTLLIRTPSPESWYDNLVNNHLAPFSIIFAIWLVVFFIAGLYEFQRLRNNFSFFKTLFLGLLINAAIAIGLFYSVPIFGIAPKTNFILFLGIFTLIEVVWRPFFNRLLARHESLVNILLIGDSAAAQNLQNVIQASPQLGYKIADWEKSDSKNLGADRMLSLIKDKRINLVLVSRSLKKDEQVIPTLYTLLDKGIDIADLPTFYEMVLRKVPLEEIESLWLLDHLSNQVRLYDKIKRNGEFFAAVILQVILIPVEIVIAILIRITSNGPVIYNQVRTGKGGRRFTLYKFRTMRIDAEKQGPQWSHAGDTRVTGIGKVLRYTHLDELPQLINIIKGELSFVGPRPERPELITLIKDGIPYYDIRNIVIPGITGWAQVCYKYGSSIEDTKEKLQYDIYYMKNRSFFLDIIILLKTIRMFFVPPATPEQVIAQTKLDKKV